MIMIDVDYIYITSHFKWYEWWVLLWYKIIDWWCPLVIFFSGWVAQHRWLQEIQERLGIEMEVDQGAKKKKILSVAATVHIKTPEIQGPFTLW